MVKQFQPLTQLQQQTSRFVGLGISQFVQRMTEKYRSVDRSYPDGFPLIFWKPQTRLFWGITQHQMDFNLHFALKLHSIVQNQQISRPVRNELLSQMLSSSFTTPIDRRSLQWFYSSFPLKVAPFLVYSHLMSTQLNTSRSTLTKINQDFSRTLTVNPQRVDQEQRSHQTFSSPAMTLFLKGDVWEKRVELQMYSKMHDSTLSVTKEAQNLSSLEPNRQLEQPKTPSLTSTEADFPLLTQRNINKLLFMNRGQFEQSFFLTHRHPLPIRSITSTAVNDRPSQEAKTVPFLELTTQKPTKHRPSPSLSDNPSLALPYYRTNAPVTQELAKVKTQLATLQADTQYLSSQAIAAQPTPTPLTTGEVNYLADQVYQVIERKIRIERERRGR